MLFGQLVVGLGPNLGGLKNTKVKNLKGAPSNPIPLVKRSSEQFLFSRLLIWKALIQHLLTTIVNLKQARKLQDAQAEKLTSLQAKKLTS